MNTREVSFNWYTLARVRLPWINEPALFFSEARHRNSAGEIVRTVRAIHKAGWL